MINTLTIPINCDDDDVRFDLVPKVYYPNNNNSHSITFPYGTSIPVENYGVLPRISIRKPRKYKVENRERIALTSKFD